MEFASQSGTQPQQQQLELFDEDGNPVLIEELPIDKSGGSTEKVTGMIIVLLGLACSLFVAFKIKRKVEEINKAAEQAEAAGGKDKKE